MNYRRSYSDRREGAPRGNSARGNSNRGGGFNRRGGGKPAPPMLMGMPSPSLAKINRMRPDELREKIKSLETEQAQITARIDRLNAVDPVPTDKIKALLELKSRLDALKDVATKKLAADGAQTSPRSRMRSQ